MPRKVLLAIPPGFLDEIDEIAALEHRTRSDLLREAARMYIRIRKNKATSKPAFQFETFPVPADPDLLPV
jgi:metal-responsive CopG/Arc/MetJ family transcriptional regulator